MNEVPKYQPIEEVLRKAAERIVDQSDDKRWARCPCCGYDGLWPDERLAQVEEVLNMLRTGFGT